MNSADPELERAVRRVLRHYSGIGREPIPESLGNHSGFSGAHIWRVTLRSRQYCLRAWPPQDPSRQRLLWLHGLMAVANRAGLAFVPSIFVNDHHTTCTDEHNRLWELSSWMPGQADFHAHPSRSRLEAACIALGRLHEAWRPRTPVRSPCPAVQRRLQRTREWIDLIDAGWRPGALAPDNPLCPLLERAWHLLQRHIGQVPGQLLVDSITAMPVQPCLCDVWHDHLLFEDEQVSGVIDYGAVKFDHIAVDLARMLGSLVGDDREMWAIGLRAYGTVRNLSASEESLVRTLDRTGTVLALGSWLRWIYRERRRFPDELAVTTRLTELVERVERWDV